ncbi:MAG: hypothetical protein LQ337_000628 [Flavoplaca oasis]|nr:MAG: hypothetical protein LQ337_000628 [Flavoplaca oasis]
MKLLDPERNQWRVNNVLIPPHKNSLALEDCCCQLGAHFRVMASIMANDNAGFSCIREAIETSETGAHLSSKPSSAKGKSFG